LLVPNRWTQAFVADRIAQGVRSGGALFIFDGYPRTPAAAQHLLDRLQEARLPVQKVLHLSISKQEMLHRASQRGRIDDDPAALLERYEFYVESVQPSVDYMKDRLGSQAVALIDAHQPSYDVKDGGRVLNLERSIANVVRSCLLALSDSPAPPGA
jgi:adenylate kinase family enzyme